MSPEGTWIAKGGRALLIRRPTEADAETLIEHVKLVDAETEFTSREAGEFQVPVATERLFLKKVSQQDNALFLTVWDQAVLVATLHFNGGQRTRDRHAGEFGMGVLRSHWGLGIGGELMSRMIAWAEAHPEVRRIALRVDAGNVRARALYERMGFALEGTLRGAVRIQGVDRDLLVMARRFAK